MHPARSHAFMLACLLRSLRTRRCANLRRALQQGRGHLQQQLQQVQRQAVQQAQAQAQAQAQQLLQAERVRMQQQLQARMQQLEAQVVQAAHAHAVAAQPAMVATPPVLAPPPGTPSSAGGLGRPSADMDLLLGALEPTSVTTPAATPSPATGGAPPNLLDDFFSSPPPPRSSGGTPATQPQGQALVEQYRAQVEALTRQLGEERELAARQGALWKEQLQSLRTRARADKELARQLEERLRAAQVRGGTPGGGGTPRSAGMHSTPGQRGSVRSSPHSGATSSADRPGTRGPPTPQDLQDATQALRKNMGKVLGAVDRRFDGALDKVDGLVGRIAHEARARSAHMAPMSTP